MVCTKTLLVTLLAATVLAIPISDMGFVDAIRAVLSSRATDVPQGNILTKCGYTDPDLVGSITELSEQVVATNVELAKDPGKDQGKPKGCAAALNKVWVKNAKVLLDEAKVELQNSYRMKGEDLKQYQAAVKLKKSGDPTAYLALQRETADMVRVDDKIADAQLNVKQISEAYERLKKGATRRL